LCAGRELRKKAGEKKAGEGIRTLDIQLGKRARYQRKSIRNTRNDRSLTIAATHCNDHFALQP